MKADLQKFRRRMAFRQIFRRDVKVVAWVAWCVKALRSKRAAYRAVFENEDGEIVLAHLARFCHLKSTTFRAGEPDSSAYFAGQRDVFLEIQRHLSISETQLRDTMRREDAINAA